VLVLQRVAAGARVGPQPPHLGAPVPAREVRRDPEQPRERVGALLVVAGHAAQRAGERLGREVLGDRRVEPTAQIGMDRCVVAIEDPRERRRILARAGDQLSVARGARRRRHDRVCAHVRAPLQPRSSLIVIASPCPLAPIGFAAGPR
jgi:hypothetical protein